MALTHSIRRLVLSGDAAQHPHLQGTLLALGVYAVCLLLQWHAVHVGRASSALAVPLMLMIAVGPAAFFCVIRSGVVRHLPDPALTMPQMLFAMTCLALAYRINPSVRGILLMVVALVLVFGAFTLRPARCRALGWCAVAIFGAVMAWGALTDPLHFEPYTEGVHFIFTVSVLPVLAVLSGQLSGMRNDLRRQKRELQAALERVQLLATHDELTGLPNRRHVQEWIVHEAARSRRIGAPLCLALLDLDHFKRINDELGHGAGDVVLCIFAREASAILRDSDVLARWGGEEFLLAMPDTSLQDAAVALQRLRERLLRDETWADCPRGRVTFSAGLTLRQHPQTLEQAVHRADEALYEAKHAGRDRVVVRPAPA